MPNTHYDSQLDAVQIEAALEAIDGVVTPGNNGKVLCIVGGKIAAKSASEWGGGSPTLQSKTVTPGASQQIVLPDLGYDGLSDVTVNGDTNLVAANIKKDVEIFGVTGSYEGSGGSAVVQPLNATENGTYNPPSGVDGFAPVTVNVSGGGGGDVEPTLPVEYQEVEYIDFDGNSYVTIDSQYIQNGDLYETFASYTDGNTSEQALIGVDNPSNSQRFEMYFSGGQAQIYIAGSICARAAIDTLVNPSTSVSGVNTNVSLGAKKYFMLELFSWSGNKKLKIGAYGTSSKYRSRLFKIKHKRRTNTIGNAASSEFGNYQYEAFSWYKPCYRKADNVPGWYDTRTDTFYTNEGTGSFTVGPDVT